jgi:hypothetical protein
MESSSSLTVEQLRCNCNTLYFPSPGMGFVRRNFSAACDESRLAFKLAPSPIRNISHTKIPGGLTRQIIERPELVPTNADCTAHVGFQTDHEIP